MKMWNEIINKQTLFEFITLIDSFHDSCIKEIRYISGAYVAPDLSMHPINDQRKLRVVVQRQSEEYPVIEMEFEGLNYLKLLPVEERYTSEILASTFLMGNNCIYWCDSDGLTESDIEQYTGTIICASKLRWRSISKSNMGNAIIYNTRTCDIDTLEHRKNTKDNTLC